MPISAGRRDRRGAGRRARARSTLRRKNGRGSGYRRWRLVQWMGMVFLSTAVSRVTDAWAKDTLEGGCYGAASGAPLGFGKSAGVPVTFFGAIGEKLFD